MGSQIIEARSRRTRASASSSSSSSPPPSFENGEVILVEYGGELYPAKVTGVDFPNPKSEDTITYIGVHYHGWSKKRDEWLPDDDARLHKWTPENVKKQQEMRQARIAATQLLRKTKTKSVSTATSSNSRSPSIESDIEQKFDPATATGFASSHSRTEVSKYVGNDTPKFVLAPAPSRRRFPNISSIAKPPSPARASSPVMVIDLPDKLKIALVDDATTVNDSKNATVAMFPVKKEKNIDSILADYLNDDDDSRLANKDDASDVCFGIKEYFEGIVKAKLLYRVEHVQLQKFEEGCQEKLLEVPELTSIFGGAHLLRLFTFLGTDRKFATTFRSDDMSTLVSEFEKFLQFLLVKFDKYF